MFACFNVCSLFLLIFSQIPYDYFSRQTVLTQWAEPFLHSPWSNHILFFMVTNSMFACFQMYDNNMFYLVIFFFNFHLTFLVHRHVLTQ